MSEPYDVKVRARALSGAWGHVPSEEEAVAAALVRAYQAGERAGIEKFSARVVVAAAEVSVPSGFGTPIDDATMRRPLDGTARIHVDGEDVTEALHPNGACTCCGEGRCLWCLRAAHTDLSARHAIALKWRAEYYALRTCLTALMGEARDAAARCREEARTDGKYLQAPSSAEYKRGKADAFTWVRRRIDTVLREETRDE